MITVNSNKGIIKIRKKMLILTLALSTSLTGCSLSRQPKELNIKKINYKLDDVNKTSSKKEYKLRSQSGDSKAVFHIFDNKNNHNINNAEITQVENVKLLIKDEKNNIVDIFTTKKNEEYLVKHLTPGEYTLEIINTPNNYQSVESIYSFKVYKSIEINQNTYTVNYIDIPLERIESKKLIKTK